MPANRPKRPTMAQVARLAGVSPTTVSFVINDDPRGSAVPAATRLRVEEAVRALGYRPNHAARRLRTQRSETIGFITDEVATTAFAGDTIRGAHDAAWARHHLLTVLNTGGAPEVEEASVDTVLSRDVDGVIFAAMYTREVTPPRGLEDVRTVLLNCFTTSGRYPSVVPAEMAGGRAATRILLEAGHRRIGFVNGLPTTYAAGRRLEGYRQALREYGVSYDQALVRHGTYRSDSGHAHVRDLLLGDDPPTAIFCASDRMAVGAYYAIKELGLSIPGDVSVVGYDNQIELAAYASPPLTTIQLPHYEMGRWAAEYLLDGGPAGPVPHEIDCPAVIRDSVAPPRTG